MPDDIFFDNIMSRHMILPQGGHPAMGFTESFLNFFSGRVPAADPADQEIARKAYADFLEAQLLGFATPRSAELRQSLYCPGEGAAEAPDGCDDARKPADFPTLMGVETQLAGDLPDILAGRTYWIVRDRFHRVASPSALVEYSKWSPPELRESPDAPVEAPLAVAKRAATAALAEVGRTGLERDRARAAADADPAAADKKAAAVAAGKAYDAAVVTSVAASKRVKELESAAPTGPEAASGAASQQVKKPEAHISPGPDPKGAS
jgi:hypothetical protein